MASFVTSGILPCFGLNSDVKPRFQARVQSSASVALKLGRLKPSIEEKKWVNDFGPKDLEPLWDDGYGTKTIKDYFDGAKEMIRPDGGPPRWFCPIECGQPLKSSPTLLYLPGVDGVGLGLTLHHKALGKAFEVLCLHIPVYDRTPFEGLVKFVEETVRLEHARNPNKPIYLVGESIGGCLAIAVAARNPKVDLVVILANPATSFGRSKLQPFLPILEAAPNQLHNGFLCLLSLLTGNPVKMAMVGVEDRLPSRLKIGKLYQNLMALLHNLSVVADIIPKDTLVWKMKLLRSAADYANTCLHNVKAEVLLLASEKDRLLPSRDEALRLKSLLQNCTVRNFKGNGHAILLEDGVGLLTAIKGTSKYRRSKRIDFVSDYLPPSTSEFKSFFEEAYGLLLYAAGSTMFSTLEDGKIVKGLAGVPNEGPVLLVGYHMLMAFDIYPLGEGFLREKNIMVRGLGHPDLFTGKLEDSSNEFAYADWIRVMGTVAGTASNLFKLLSTKSHVVLYPGGARESLHNKGEEYKLFWPDQQEFVRTAARFGATIVPFGTVGEDDLTHLVLDYHDMMKIPIVSDYIREVNSKATRIRDNSKGEVANQQVYIPGVLPKLPGRFYYLFGKPIKTKGMEDMLRDRENANQLYLHVKSEVENNIAYLLKKREEDPYRSLINRTIYQALHSPSSNVPTFDP
ncbi:phytyl ester synthase 1, chloroplastic-like [Populus nigra]|uniref:phytyl ester synthase 1, chloroplastic-like n=1 Tax=Populus nigra TaxID=3691 RepID=UPI002B26C189|nr:phytyl ester synthase 1, chloroplastic-like [Populus nigra]